MTDLYVKIVAIIKGINDSIQIEVSEFSTSIFDLGFDSLDHASFLLAIEEELSVKIPDDVAESLISVDDLVRYVDCHYQAK